MLTVLAEAYSAKHLKHKLLHRYGHQKLFAEVNGHPDVVCFRGVCSYFISNKWYAERKTNTREESEQIVCTAGKLIASALRDLNLDTDHFLMTDWIWSLSQGEKSPPPGPAYVTRAIKVARVISCIDSLVSP